MRFADWFVLGAYGLMMLLVGAYYSRRTGSAEEFLLGGRKLSPVALGLSLFATLVSTLSYLGNPGEMIGHGPMMFTQVASFPIVFVIVGYGLIPLLMRQPVTSAYELLETRLGGSIRLAGAVVFLLLRLGWMATILFATSDVVLVPLLGLSHSWTPILVVMLGIVTATYSSAGGLKAVVITDAIQSVTMLAGAVVTIVVITTKMGGVSGWWPTQWPTHWDNPSWGFDPQARVSFGILIVSTTLWYVCTNGSDQMSVQRFLATRDASAARKTLGVAQLTDGLVSILLGIAGIAIMGFYRSDLQAIMDPTELHQFADKCFPRFIMTEMPPGLSGIVMAAILSAALSSLSSGVNSACAVLEKDVVPSLVSGSLSVEGSLSRLRGLTWLVMLAAMGVSMLNLFFEGNLVERCFKVINLLTAPLFVLFFLALFVPWSNAIGAWAGLVGSTLVAIAIAYAGDLHLPWTISFIWMVPASLMTGIVVGSLVSMMAPKRPLSFPDHPANPS